MEEIAIKIENLKKEYILGLIGGTTLNAELQSWWARVRGKEDPNTIVGQNQSNGKFWALNGIDIKVKRGEALGIIGANGAGKSTLLKILSRVTAPTEGDIWINGRISSMLEVGTGFHGELTGRENIYMNGAILGMSKREVDAKIDNIIEFSECEKFIDTPVKRYSSGMYVKLAFAVAASLDSEILVMDEVLAVGDMKFQEKCLGRMGDIAGGEGRTVLYVSHNMSTIRSLCTRCVVLEQGRVIFEGDVETAVEVYLGQCRNELLVRHEFDYVKRASVDSGQKIFIHSLEFIDKEQAVFNSTEIMKFKIDWEALEDISNIRIRFVIVRTDSTVVGMACSAPVISARKGTRKTAIFEYDSTNLTAGIYSFHIMAFETNEFGTVLDYDKPLQRMYFEIIDSNENYIQWSNKWWGNVKLNPFELVEMR